MDNIINTQKRERAIEAAERLRKLTAWRIKHVMDNKNADHHIVKIKEIEDFVTTRYFATLRKDEELSNILADIHRLICTWKQTLKV